MVLRSDGVTYQWVTYNNNDLNYHQNKSSAGGCFGFLFTIDRK